MRRLSFILIVIVCLCNEAAQAQFEGYSWKTIKTTTAYIPREECDFVSVKSKFYLLGGRKIENVNIFDPRKLTWTEGTKPMFESNHFQAVVYKDFVYLCGAMTGNYPHERPLDHIYIYDAPMNRWIRGDEIPKDRLRGAGGMVTYKDKFYMVGGITDGHWTGSVAWFDEYDPKTGEWKKLPDAPIARDHFKAAVVGHKLYCIAGQQSNAMEKKSQTIDEVDIYDFKTGAWSVANAKLPTPRGGNSVVVVDDDILIIGGESSAQKQSHNDVEAYNVTKGEFRKLPPINEGRHAGAALYFNKRIYTVAGVGNAGGSPLLTSIEFFSNPAIEKISWWM